MNPENNNQNDSLRVGFFGGTFDPPHLGHSLACFYCLERGLVDRIVVAPCAEHAFGKETEAPFADRVEMTRRAMARLGDAVEVTDIEGRLEQPSYTIDTLGALRETLPAGAQLRLIIGSDNVADFDKWKDVEELKEMAPLIVVPRMEDNPQKQENAEWNKFAIPAVSSTQIREKLKKGESVEKLLSEDVLQYIQQHGLYKNT